MRDTSPIPSIAPLRNVAAMITLVDRVASRDFSLPGMATFYGPSGWGKTTAVTVTANEFSAYSVQVKSVWSPTHFCRAVLAEMAVPPAKTIPEMVDQIGGHLARADRPLIMDDAQYLKAKRMIELVRDIYESCQTPIILVGEEQLPQALTQWENVHNRMLAWVPAQPCDLEDAWRLKTIYCRAAEVDERLMEAIVAASGGSIRRVAVNLSRVQELARNQVLRIVTRENWGDREFDTGQPPAARQNLGAVTRLGTLAADGRRRARG